MGREIQIGGWKAGLVILALAGFSLYRLSRLPAALDRQAKEPIRRELVSIYQKDFQQATDRLNRGGLTAEESRQILRRPKVFSGIEIVSLQARRVEDSEYAVRVEFTVEGKPPPDGKTPRYFRVQKRAVGDWYVLGETSALLYWLALW